MTGPSRWDRFTEQERHMLHHALRVLATHPIPSSPGDAELRDRLANELWDLHCELVATRTKRS